VAGVQECVWAIETYLILVYASIDDDRYMESYRYALILLMSADRMKGVGGRIMYNFTIIWPRLISKVETYFSHD